jgi:hypothetical protein
MSAYSLLERLLEVKRLQYVPHIVQRVDMHLTRAWQRCQDLRKDAGRLGDRLSGVTYPRFWYHEDAKRTVDEVTKAVDILMTRLQLYNLITWRDMEGVLELLYGYAYYGKNIKPLTTFQATDTVILDFIIKYGGNPDSLTECWAAKELEGINEMESWNGEEILRQVRERKAEWDQLQLDMKY